MTLLDLRLRGFLDEVAAEGRLPGGGAVAAIVTAASAALVAKVARTSRGAWPEAAGAAAQADALCRRIAPVAQMNADEYGAVFRARADTSRTGADRDEALGRAYSRAAEAPLRIGEAATDVALLAAAVARCGDQDLRADAATAAALAAAAARAAAKLVAVNLTATPDDDRVRRASAFARDAARAAEDAFEPA